MKHRGWICVWVLLLIAALSCTVSAEVRKEAFTISPMAGGYSFDDERDLLDMGPMFSLGLGYQFTESLATELTFSFIHTDADICCGNADVYAYQPRLDILYHIMPDSDFVPYVAAGVGGLMFDDNDLDPVELDDTFQVNGGAGFKLFISDDVALRADGRYYHGFENSSNEFSVEAGLVFQIGGVKKAPEPCADDDNDGVCNTADRCPNTPAGSEVDAMGCPNVEPDTGMQKSPGTGMAMEESDKSPAPEMMQVVVYFDFDSTNVKSMYQGRLEELAKFMKEYPQCRASIEGHTDSIGSDTYNMKLSEQRASSVMKYMQDNFGINASRFDLSGKGEREPAASNKTADGRKQNRRAITITIME